MAEDNLYAPPESDVSVSDSVELASRGLRLGGAIIDGIVMMVIIWPVIYFTGFFERSFAGEETLVDLLVTPVLGMGVFLLLNGYLLANYGQTVGKRLVKTQIVGKDDQRILPFGRVVALRYLPTWVISQIPVIGQIFGLANALFVFRGDRRCIHDLIAGTVVINARN